MSDKIHAEIEREIRDICNSNISLGAAVGAIKSLLQDNTSFSAVDTLAIRGSGYGFSATTIMYSYMLNDKLHLNYCNYSAY